MEEANLVYLIMIIGKFCKLSAILSNAHAYSSADTHTYTYTHREREREKLYYINSSKYSAEVSFVQN